MVKKIYDGKASGKIGRGQPWLTFENTVSRILKEGHIKSMRTCIKRLITLDEAKEECRDRSVWHSILSDYPPRNKA